MEPASVLALVSPAVAVAIALWGFRRSTRSDKLKAFFQMHDRYLAPDVRTGRRIIHDRVAGRTAAEIAALTDDIRGQIGSTLAVMNSIAIACEAGYVDRDVVMVSMGESYAGVMRSARPYVDHAARVNGYRPYGYAERLAAYIDASLGGAPARRRLVWWRRPTLAAPPGPAPSSGGPSGP
jgi:hypothetical protein